MYVTKLRRNNYWLVIGSIKLFFVLISKIIVWLVCFEPIWSNFRIIIIQQDINLKCVLTNNFTFCLGGGYSYRGNVISSPTSFRQPIQNFQFEYSHNSFLFYHNN